MKKEEIDQFHKLTSLIMDRRRDMYYKVMQYKAVTCFRRLGYLQML